MHSQATDCRLAFLLQGRDWASPLKRILAMYLRDIAVYADERIADRYASGFVGWFHRESCCVTDLYSSVLGKSLTTLDTVKVNLLFTEHDALAPTLRQLINVADADWEFDFSKYVDRDVGGKKEMILDSLQEALIWIATKRKWDATGFRQCHAEIIRRNLDYSGWSKKSWVSPNAKYKAKIGFSFGLRIVDFFVGIFDRKGREIGQKPMCSVVPEMGVAHLVLKGSGSWNDGNVFCVQIADSYFHLPKSWQVDCSDLLP
jgi:hypothetical protein